MKKSLFFIFFLSIFISPFSLFAEEGFLGENPGFDFYSKIDEGGFKILRKTVEKRLTETPEMQQFAKNCLTGSLSLAGIPTKGEMLSDIEMGDYSDFNVRLIENIKARGGNISISSSIFTELTTCITSEYQKLKRDAQKETDARVEISYLGLYMDGDKTNSEYDIITDIEKINRVVFSEDLKYGGSPNASGQGFKNFLSNVAIPPLYPIAAAINNANVNNTPPGNIPLNPINATGTLDPLSNLLGTTCSPSYSGSVENLVDDAFLAELSRTLGSEVGVGSVGDGYTRGQDPYSPSLSGNAQSAMTSAGDFFHELPCDSMFCIKVKMVPGSTNLLGGGKNISIEGILDKSIKHLQPIAESALGCEIHTNNGVSTPKKGLNLITTLAGLKVFLASNPQKTTRDKKSVTPEREAEEREEIKRCAYATTGLPTEGALSRSIGGAGYTTTQFRTTADVTNNSIPLGPQEATEIARFTECVTSHMQTGRRSYYESFSTDLTEIQTYTASMLNDINSIISNLTLMDNKPVGCRN